MGTVLGTAQVWNAVAGNDNITMVSALSSEEMLLRFYKCGEVLSQPPQAFLSRKALGDLLIACILLLAEEIRICKRAPLFLRIEHGFFEGEPLGRRISCRLRSSVEAVSGSKLHPCALALAGDEQGPHCRQGTVQYAADVSHIPVCERSQPGRLRSAGERRAQDSCCGPEV